MDPVDKTMEQTVAVEPRAGILAEGLKNMSVNIAIR